jgi:phosphinothricin acetyltransferase
MSEIVFRPVERGDLVTLTDIYNHYVRETSITFDIEPRTIAQRQVWLDGFSVRGRYRCFVAVKDGSAIGWASSHRYNERAAYDTTVLTSIYLAPDMTGQGIGRRLYAVLFDALKDEDIHQAFGGITQPNPASVRLHEAMGFEKVGVYREVGRKFGRYWDVATYLRPMANRP